MIQTASHWRWNKAAERKMQACDCYLQNVLLLMIKLYFQRLEAVHLGWKYAYANLCSWNSIDFYLSYTFSYALQHFFWLETYS